MLKTKRIGSFKFPYPMLISRILDHFQVDNQDEVFHFVELEFEVKAKALKQMGYIEVEEGARGWIKKPKKEEGSVATTIKEVEEKPIIPFELIMMMVKMDELMRIHKEDYRDSKSSFGVI